MQSELVTILEQHSEWLSGLRWVGRWESVCIVIALIGTALATVCGGVYLGLLDCLALLGGHVLATGAIFAAAGRRYSSALLALIGFSGIHVWLWLMQKLPHGHEIALGYLCIGVLMAVIACVTAWCNEKRWRALGHAQERDDFRWLVTTAPLLLRWRLLRWLGVVRK